MVDERGEWNWIHLQGLLPAATLERLAACPIPKPLYGDDCPGWRWEDNRCFKDNLSSVSGLQRPGMDWGMRFSIWCWLLWKLRCCIVLDDEFSEREGVLDIGYRLIVECLMTLVEEERSLWNSARMVEDSASCCGRDSVEMVDLGG
ncbi:hypothetical protein V6N13_082833 [Hibiscus sabdariffa]